MGFCKFTRVLYSQLTHSYPCSQWHHCGRGQANKKRNVRRAAALEAFRSLDWVEEDEVEMMVVVSDDE